MCYKKLFSVNISRSIKLFVCITLCHWWGLWPVHFFPLLLLLGRLDDIDSCLKVERWNWKSWPNPKLTFFYNWSCSSLESTVCETVETSNNEKDAKTYSKVRHRPVFIVKSKIGLFKDVMNLCNIIRNGMLFSGSKHWKIQQNRHFQHTDNQKFALEHFLGF